MPDAPRHPDPTPDEPEWPPLPNPPEAPPIPDLLTRPVERRAAPTTSQAGRDILRAGAAWSLAMEFVFTILAGAFLGYFADRWLKASPKLTLAGLALGFGVAFYRIVHRTAAQEKADAAERQRRHGPRR